MIVSDSSGREIMWLTDDRKLIFAEDVTPQDAARVFAEHVGRLFGWTLSDEAIAVVTK